MKPTFLSGQHLSCGASKTPRNDTDVVIRAYSIVPLKDAASRALGFSKPVLCVAGHHEFCASNIVGGSDKLKNLRAGTTFYMCHRARVVEIARDLQRKIQSRGKV